MARLLGRLMGLVAVLAALPAAPRASTVVIEILKASGGLPAHVVSSFQQPLAFVQTKDGQYLVLDARAHTVYAVDAAQRTVKALLEIGLESGRVLQPGGFALGPNDIFAVSDAPTGFQRVQYFSLAGSRLGGFVLSGKLTPRLTAGRLVLSGVGSMQFTGKTFLINVPESGALISELDSQGTPLRQIDILRLTGHEEQKDLHLALNAGLPLIDPTGGFYFVFQTGPPALRKYDAKGRLVFERHIEGIELDEALRTQPTTWPTQTYGDQRLPLVLPLVRTAAVDPDGRLWVALVAPYVYVYDRNGEKLKTLQLEAAGTLAPTSLFFPSRGRLLVTPGCYEFRFNW